MTWGHEIVVGRNTLRQLPPLPGRVILSAEQFAAPGELMDYVRGACQHVYLIGGVETFAKFAGVVDRWYIDKTSYDGHSDEWINPMWLVAEAE
jgi:dihydrofolate reductase